MPAIMRRLRHTCTVIEPRLCSDYMPCNMGVDRWRGRLLQGAQEIRRGAARIHNKVR